MTVAVICEVAPIQPDVAQTCPGRQGIESGRAGVDRPLEDHRDEGRDPLRHQKQHEAKDHGPAVGAEVAAERSERVERPNLIGREWNRVSEYILLNL